MAELQTSLLTIFDFFSVKLTKILQLANCNPLAQN